MTDTIIFDLDGTLLNTLDDLADSTNYALRKCGFPERSIDEIRSFVGNGVRLLIERAVPETRPKRIPTHVSGFSRRITTKTWKTRRALTTA